MKKIATILATLSLTMSPFAASTASAAVPRNGSCAEAIDEVVASGWHRSTLYCNGAVRSNTWRVHHTNGCTTDVTFYNSGDIGGWHYC